MRVPLLNSEGGPGVLPLNFEGGPGVPLLNFRDVPVPLLNFDGSSGSQGHEVPGSGVLVPLVHHTISIDIVIMIKSSELTLGFAVLFVILEGLKHRKLLTSQF